MIFTTFVPTHYNDGSEIPAEVIGGVLASFWIRYGGMTQEGLVTGHWVEPRSGRHYVDVNHKVRVRCDDDRLAEVEAHLRSIGRLLRQNVMYLEVDEGSNVRFLEIE